MPTDNPVRVPLVGERVVYPNGKLYTITYVYPQRPGVPGFDVDVSHATMSDGSRVAYVQEWLPEFKCWRMVVGAPWTPALDRVVVPSAPTRRPLRIDWVNKSLEIIIAILVVAIAVMIGWWGPSLHS